MQWVWQELLIGRSFEARGEHVLKELWEKQKEQEEESNSLHVSAAPFAERRETDTSHQLPPPGAGGYHYAGAHWPGLVP